MRFKAAILLCAILLGVLPASSFAADPNMRVLIDREKVLASAAKADLNRFPDADTVLVDDFEMVEYNPDGSGRHWDENYVKVLTEKGKRETRTLSLDFTLPYSRAHVLVGEIIKPDGRVVPIDIAANSREMVDPSQMGSNIYNPNDKALQVSAPGLEIGDVIHWLAFVEEFKPRMERTWCGYFVLESTNPVLAYTVEVSAPDAMPVVSKALKDEVKDRVSYTKKSADGKTVHRWVAGEIPQYFPEPEMPAPYTVVQRLMLSTIPDWQTVSKWYWNLSKPRLDSTTPEMKAKVEEITKGLTTDDAKIRAIFKFVSQSIRYMGITTEEVSPGYEPHDVSMTFNNKYGVCRDKAALLVAMLRMAGLEAFPVLINAGPKKDPEIPQPYFNHAISCVLNADGSYTLMDSTDETSAELLPAYLCDRSYLVARPDGDILRTSPIIPASKNMMRISTKGSVDESGVLSAKTSFAFDGINDNAYRGHLLRVRPEERKLFFESKLKGAIDGAVLKSLKVEPADLQDCSKPLTAEIEYTVKDVLASGPGESIMPVPWLGGSFGTVNFILGATGLEKRRFPFDTEIACGAAENVEMALGQGVGRSISVPKCGNIDSDTVKWAESVAVENGVLKASAEFAIKAVEFSPKQYLDLREALKTVQADRRKRPVFASADDAVQQDSILLDDNMEISLSDAGSWTSRRQAKRKILSYAGTKRFSELKIGYNPIWETVSVKAKVTAPDGSVKTLGEKELNVMDASWVGSAPRYPAGKTLVASLPGVGIGSVIETDVAVERKGRLFFSLSESFKSHERIESKTVTVRLPASLAGRLKLGTPADEVADGGRTLIWRAKDVAPLKSEPSLPPLWTFTKTAGVSAGDWTSFSDAAAKALKGAAKGALTEAKAKELCSGAVSQSARVTRIRDFVAKSIRLAGPGFTELPLSCITPADKTLADGYGNGPDRAVLLFALLKAAGFEPEFTLASGLPSIPAVFAPFYYTPQEGLFSAPLVRVKADGKDILLNDTNQYDQLGATAHSGSYSLDVDTHIPLVVRAAEKSMENFNEIQWSIAIEADGSAALERTQLFYGMGYGNARQRYAEMTPEELRRHHQELVAAVAQSAKADGPIALGFESYPGRLSFKVRIPDFAVRDGARLYFQLPEGGFRRIFSLRAERRSSPFYIGGRSNTGIVFDFRLPESFTRLPIAPRAFDWSHAGSSVSLTSEFEPGHLELRCDALFEPSLTPSAEYGVYKELDRLLGDPSTSNIMLSE